MKTNGDAILSALIIGTEKGKLKWKFDIKECGEIIFCYSKNYVYLINFRKDIETDERYFSLSVKFKDCETSICNCLYFKNDEMFQKLYNFYISTRTELEMADLALEELEDIVYE